MATRAKEIATTIVRVNSKLTVNTGDGSSNPAAGATSGAAAAAATDKKSLAEQRPPRLAVPEPPPLIEDIAGHPSARAAFHKFANEALVTENVNFLFAIIDIEDQLNEALAANPKTTIEEIEKETRFQEMFQTIYTRFILERASQWISISSNMRDDLTTQNNGNTITAPKSTAFKFATFKIIYNDIHQDLHDPLKRFQSQFAARRKSQNTTTPEPPGFKRTHSYSGTRAHFDTHAGASSTHPSASAGTDAAAGPNPVKATARHPLTVHVLSAHTAQTAQPPGLSALPPLSRSATVGRTVIGFDMTGAPAAQPLLYMYPPVDSSVALSFDSRTGSYNGGSHPVTTRGVIPALETHRGTGTSAMPSPMTGSAIAMPIPDLVRLPASAVSAIPDLAMPNNPSHPNPYSKLHKNTVTSLVKQLGEYLQTISSYEHDEACCTCCCFRSCKKDKPAIYRNLRDLKDSLSLSLEDWKDEKIQDTQSLISAALVIHKRIAGNKEQQMVEPLNTAAATLKGDKPKEFTMRRQS